jgi:hypothetical protein
MDTGKENRKVAQFALIVSADNRLPRMIAGSGALLVHVSFVGRSMLPVEASLGRNDSISSFSNASSRVGHL